MSLGLWVVVLSALAQAAAAAPSTKKFISRQYGYSLVLPGGAGNWSTSYALVGWATDSINPGSPAFDHFEDNRTARQIMIAARRPPTGATLAKWTAFVVTTISSDCTKPKSFTHSKLSGADALVFNWKCSGLNSIAVTALHGLRGYLLWVASPPTILSDATNLRAFEVARRAFRFRH